MKTFDQLRTEYMEKNPVPAYHPEVFLSKKITKDQLLGQLNEAGFDISERTLNYYINIGLVDKPFIGSKKKGKGKESYFSKADYELITFVKTMQNDGHSLEEIKKGVVFANAVQSLIMEPEADHGKVYFIGMTNLLIRNIPPPYRAEDIRDYLDITCSPDQRGNPVEYYISKELRRLDRAFDELKTNDTAFDNSMFWGLFDLLWSASIETLYYKLLKPNDQRNKLEIATLLRADYRVGVMLCYINSLAKTIKAWVSSPPKNELSKLPRIKKVLSRLSGNG